MTLAEPESGAHGSGAIPASVAQWSEQGTFNPRVVGSNPTGCTEVETTPPAHA